MSIAGMGFAKQVYLNTGGKTLREKDNAKFAVWHWSDKNEGSWSNLMQKVAEDVYTTDIGEDNNLVFARLHDTTTIADWNKKLNQTKDLIYDDQRTCFMMTDLINGVWNTYTDLQKILSESLLTTDSYSKFSTYNVKGERTWYCDTIYGTSMSGYSDSLSRSFANEDWLISPSMDLSLTNNAFFIFEHSRGPKSVINVGLTEGYYTVWVSNDYISGAPSSATWTEITNVMHTKTAWQYVSSGILFIPSEFLTTNTRIAFKYLCTDVTSATWEIKNLSVSGIRKQQSSKLVYLNTGEETLWEKDDAKFAVWHWPDGKEGSWSGIMEKVAENVYVTDIGKDNNLLFARFCDTTTVADWDSQVLNQTVDLVYNYERPCYVITSMTDGFWEKYDTIPTLQITGLTDTLKFGAINIEGHELRKSILLYGQNLNKDITINITGDAKDQFRVSTNVIQPIHKGFVDETLTVCYKPGDCVAVHEATLNITCDTIIYSFVLEGKTTDAKVTWSLKSDTLESISLGSSVNTTIYFSGRNVSENIQLSVLNDRIEYDNYNDGLDLFQISCNSITPTSNSFDSIAVVFTYKPQQPAPTKYTKTYPHFCCGNRSHVPITISYNGIVDTLIWTSSIGLKEQSLKVGNGTQENPYLINNAEELIYFTQKSEEFNTSYVQLTTDIDLSPYCGIFGSDTICWKDIFEFSGHFDGNGKSISNLYINQPLVYQLGLFGHINNAVIENIHVINANIQSFVNGYYNGGLCGWAENSEISNSSFNGKIVCGENTNIGGIVGIAKNTILRNCHVSGDVFGGTVGGICGSSIGCSLLSCYNSASIYGTEKSGNFCGKSNGDNIIGCLGNAQICGGQAGGVTGELLNPVALTNSYYDVMAGPVAAVGVGMTIDNTVGLTTLNMLGNSLEVIGKSWTFTNNMYPRLACMDTMFHVILGATPIILHSGERLDSINNDFTVGTEYGVAWKSLQDLVTFNGNMAHVNKKAGKDTLVVYKGKSERYIPIIIMQPYLSVINHNIDNDTLVIGTSEIGSNSVSQTITIIGEHLASNVIFDH